MLVTHANIYTRAEGTHRCSNSEIYARHFLAKQPQGLNHAALIPVFTLLRHKCMNKCTSNRRELRTMLGVLGGLKPYIFVEFEYNAEQ